MIETQSTLKAARYGLVTIAEPFGLFGFFDVRISDLT